MNKQCPSCGATNSNEAEKCVVCGMILQPLPDPYELKRPKAELNSPVGKWVKI